ncbi:glycosyltransferase family 39 protein, partial [Methanobrevibacter sp.]
MFNISKKMSNRLSLIIVILFSLIITITMVYQNIIHQRGIGTHYIDVYCYLIESLRLAGIQIGGYKFVNYLPPFIPFLTSIIFRLGFVSEFSIFFTTGIFHIFGIIGMYYLLKLRFNNYYSIFGAIVYGAFLINMKWIGNGTLDIAFTALMIWAIYFFILAMEKNQNYFCIAIPLAI